MVNMSNNKNVGYLLQHLSATLARQADKLLQENLSIGFSQFKILMILQWTPRLQQKEIAERLSQTEASISRQIKLLQKQGLLTVQISPSNKRQHIAVPTAKGEQVTEQAQGVLNDYYVPMMACLNEQQQQHLLNALTIMHEYACDNGAWCQVHQ